MPILSTAAALFLDAAVAFHEKRISADSRHLGFVKKSVSSVAQTMIGAEVGVPAGGATATLVGRGGSADYYRCCSSSGCGVLSGKGAVMARFLAGIENLAEKSRPRQARDAE